MGEATYGKLVSILFHIHYFDYLPSVALMWTPWLLCVDCGRVKDSVERWVKHWSLEVFGKSRPEPELRTSTAPQTRSPDLIGLLASSSRISMASIQKAAASSLRRATRPTLSQRAPALARFNASSRVHSQTPVDSQAPPVSLAGIVRDVGPQPAVPTAAMDRDNPDYQVAIDYRTS